VVDIVRRDPAAAADAAEVVSDLQRFQRTILGELAAVGLHTGGVVVDLEERETLLTSLGMALRHLPNRGPSPYHKHAPPPPGLYLPG
jgi:hypothetical protein